MLAFMTTDPKNGLTLSLYRAVHDPADLMVTVYGCGTEDAAIQTAAVLLESLDRDRATQLADVRERELIAAIREQMAGAAAQVMEYVRAMRKTAEPPHREDGVVAHARSNFDLRVAWFSPGGDTTVHLARFLDELNPNEIDALGLAVADVRSTSEARLARVLHGFQELPPDDQG